MNVFINNLLSLWQAYLHIHTAMQQVHYTVYDQFCRNCMVMNDNEFKVARPSIIVGTPSIFESLRLKQIYLYCKTIITHVLQIDLTLL